MAYRVRRGPLKGKVYRSYYAYRVEVLGYNKKERADLAARGISPKDAARYQRYKVELRRLRRDADRMDGTDGSDLKLKKMIQTFVRFQRMCGIDDLSDPLSYFD